MCFTPYISLTTFIIEFVVATYLIFFRKKSVTNIGFGMLLYVLGLYQFLEFMICSTGTPFIWAKAGFITYTFLPAIGLHFVMRYLRKRHSQCLVYAPPVIFSLYALLNSGFVVYAGCTKLFVKISTILGNQTWLIMIYLVYYFAYILWFSWLLIARITKETNKKKKQIEKMILAGTLVSLVPAMVLLVIFPSLDIMFASIYCEFSVLFALFALISSKIDAQESLNKN